MSCVKNATRNVKPLDEAVGEVSPDPANCCSGKKPPSCFPAPDLVAGVAVVRMGLTPHVELRWLLTFVLVLRRIVGADVVVTVDLVDFGFEGAEDFFRLLDPKNANCLSILPEEAELWVDVDGLPRSWPAVDPPSSPRPRSFRAFRSPTSSLLGSVQTTSNMVFVGVQVSGLPYEDRTDEAEDECGMKSLGWTRPSLEVNKWNFGQRQVRFRRVG